eukprot:TRINITY_DN1565_c0_g2_i1.p1 TRINITY_DN1565_c0_g2~~TRINITY_DN1565_c0_g2_i1.p1  ORF type:complete len:325 (+),score=64.06 TRINITY_DN1565_c0_g2_i1:55-975(+)
MAAQHAPLPTPVEQASMGVPKQRKLQKMTFVQEVGSKMFAGSVAGVVGVTSCYPIDFAKTRLQKPLPGEPPYLGLADVLKKVKAKHGAAGWYNGLRPNLTGIIPEKGLKLAVFDLVRDHLRDANGKISFKSELTAAVSAAVAQVVITTPMEIVKIRCQLTGKTMLPVIRDLGLRGMYKGYVSTLSRDVCFNLIFFPMQSFLKGWSITAATPESRKLLYSFLSGITAGMFAASLSTPADVVKTRLQAGDSGSIASVTSNIIKNEGASALFLGLGPRVAAIAPLFGIAICVYDVQKRLLLNLGYDVPM